MRSRHVEVDGSTVSFSFQGKSRVQHAIDIEDRRIARIVQRWLDLPGYELFQYVERDGTHHTIDSSDVNDYIHEATQQHFTAKDFRTWAGTVLACMTLQEFEAFDSAVQAKKNVVRAITTVAARLGNTPSVCRKCYVHPAVLDHYLGGTMAEMIKECSEVGEISHPSAALRQEEIAVMRLLQKKLAPAMG
jgi:DNA topoisomerase-1